MSLFPVFLVFRVVPDGVVVDFSFDELLVRNLGFEKGIFRFLNTARGSFPKYEKRTGLCCPYEN